ncbi:42949_t:CDS:10, partial [Gigaspora margarita]
IKGNVTWANQKKKKSVQSLSQMERSTICRKKYWRKLNRTLHMLSYQNSSLNNKDSKEIPFNNFNCWGIHYFIYILRTHFAPYKYNRFIGISQEAFVPGTKTIVFKNEIILNGKGEKVLDEEVIVIDVKKKYITPGLIDMHSTQDFNEDTHPISPYVRAQDAINPSGPEIRIIASGGVTTSLVDTLSVDDMGINANIDTEKEEPGGHYGSRKQIPATRLGEAWLSFPEDFELESLVALLRGDAKLNIHCHELWEHKKEAFHGSTKAPKIFVDAQIPVAFKSDHDIANAQHLAYEAVKAYHYGLDEHHSLAAITSVWDSHPRSLGATPLEVYIDGIPQFNTSLSVLSNETSKQSLSTILKNIDKIYVDKNHTISSEEGNISIIVKYGIIECIGINCIISSNISSYEIIDLEGGYVLPSALGLVEIELESSTSDGQVVPIRNPYDIEDIIYAIDGLKLGGKHLESAYKAGVLTA